MGIDVHGQLDAILSNVARPHKFEVNIIPPTALNNTYSMTSINTFVTSTSIPQVTIHTADFMINGRKVKIPSRMEYSQTWQCTFYLDDNYYIRRLLEVWMFNMDGFYRSNNEVMPNSGGLVSSFIGGLLDGVKAGLSATGASTSDRLGHAEVIPMTVDGRDIFKYTLQNLYPTALSDISFSNDSGQLATFTADFAFSHYTVSSPNILTTLL